MSNSLTRREIVSLVHESVPELDRKIVEKLVQKTFFHLGTAFCEGRKVELRNFGVFDLQIRQERVGRNPHHPEKDLLIPRRATIKFKPGKEIRQKLMLLDLDNLNAAPSGHINVSDASRIS